MDLSNPGVLLSSLLIGAVGMGMFMYGKRMPEPKYIGIGLALCVFPIFVHSLILMWALTALCLAGAWALPRAG